MQQTLIILTLLSLQNDALQPETFDISNYELVYTIKGCKDIGIRKFKFMAKTFKQKTMNLD